MLRSPSARPPSGHRTDGPMSGVGPCPTPCKGSMLRSPVAQFILGRVTLPFRVEREGHVAIVTLDDPSSLNALGTEMMRGLEKLWPELDTDPGCRVVLITGAGERAFCSGLKAQN